MSKTNINKIVIITAMLGEAKPITDKLKLMQSDDLAMPLQTYQTTKNNSHIVLITNGICDRYKVDRIGTQAAAITAWEAINRYSPDIIINAGTAGGYLRDNTCVGDLFIGSEAIYYHDRRISLPNFDKYGLGAFPCLCFGNLARDLNLKQGVVSSGSSLDMCKEDEINILKIKANVKDMEAAAIAEVALLKNTPLLVVKCITDIVDSSKKTTEEFLANFDFAVNLLAGKMENIVSYISGRQVEDL